ncbi:MAG: 5-(carboxyamino)imidazole ribonucleotide mutase [Deltaproteobacteria bacterium]|nr:5-(carboxyamino)imidazole ribonucleotide mutase [Deltaproteobacteria bacterium]MBN2670300.1 5-(carboxyamino)imidazole ribonucleotide mutase [Deltaproteobacteria bacterium]
MSKSVLIVMGSENDFDKVAPAIKVLKQLAVPFTVAVASAHRSPERAAKLAKSARADGHAVIIAAAGAANHLGGAMAANSTLPVIGLPIEVGGLGGIDALLSTVQMPGGVPMAGVGVNCAKNAGLIAASIISISDDALAAKLDAERITMAEGVVASDARVQAKLS